MRPLLTSPTVAWAVYVSTKKTSQTMRSSHHLATRTRSHVANNLSSINAYPIESGVRKDIAMGLNVNDRSQMKLAEQTCYS